jgi:hypothetical protein
MENLKICPWSMKMEISKSAARGYISAALLGAAAGGVAVVVLTRAIPKMLSRLGPSMMQNMMMQMGGEGCNPEEM